LLPILGWSEPWRFITSAFLHGGLMHIVFNMFALWLLGGYLEPMLGRLRFVLLYLVSALGGGVAYVLLTPLTSRVGAVGASGAVFGLFGAVIILNKALRRDTAGIWVNLAINAVLPFVYPNIAWQAHVGGFLTGMALAFVYARARRNQTLAYGGTAAITLAIGALGAARYLVG
ncbi:MAG TPA: rhomboid family intramembrane serine protease, partial [Tetrasphaera sp.]|nr:rhomboid family intramembrane serine protease [Tetrasphaera sp.]